MKTWLQDVKKNEGLSTLMALIESNADYLQKTNSKYTTGNPKSKLPGEVGIYFEEGTDRYIETDWIHVSTNKDLIELLKLIPDDALVNKDVRLIKNFKTGKYTVQIYDANSED